MNILEALSTAITGNIMVFFDIINSADKIACWAASCSAALMNMQIYYTVRRVDWCRVQRSFLAV